MRDIAPTAVARELKELLGAKKTTPLSREP